MHDVLREAARLFNDKFYFECHDLLEEAWSEAKGEEKRFLHGLIHASVGMYHVATVNHQGAVNLLSRTIEVLTPFAPHHETLDVAGLLAAVEVCLDKSRRALAGEDVEWHASDVPRMRLDEPAALE